jgi:hypothetical protein
MSVIRIVPFLAVAAAIAFLGLTSAQAADAGWPVEEAAASDAGDCADAGALRRIERRFAHAEHDQWKRGFVMQTLDNPRPSGHPYYEPGIVKRDYCVADSIMTDGAAYTVYYTIEHRVGFVGFGTYVDFCVPGLDPWRVHDGSCRTVR